MAERLNENIQKDYSRVCKCNTLAKTISRYGFEGLIHYTDFDNLESILGCGYLKSRNYQIAEGSTWVDSAMQDAITKTDSEIKNYVRFFYFYRTPTVYRFEQTSVARNSEQVVLVFKSDIMGDNGTLFTERIAAGYHGELCENPGDALLFPWKEIAERGKLPFQYYYPSAYDRKKKHRQAEFLYPQKISLDALEAIYFKSPEVLGKARKRFGNNPKFRLDIEHKRFNYDIVRREANLCA